MNLFSEHELGVGIMQIVVELEFGSLARLLDGPAGEAARYFGDVFLRVAAVNAEGVQFHQLAAVIFIQTAIVFLLLGRRCRRRSPAAVAGYLAGVALLRFALRGARIGAQ